MKAEIALIVLMFVAFAGGAGIIGLINHWHWRKLTDLQVDPEARAKHVMHEFFREYLSSLKKSIEEEIEKLSEIKLPMAREVAYKKLQYYWIASIEELKKRGDQEEIWKALDAIGHSRDAPYGSRQMDEEKKAVFHTT